MLRLSMGKVVVALILLAINLQAASFAPTDLSGCHIWFDAGTLAALSDGAAVTQWVDTASGYAAIQTNAAVQPTFVTNALNGQAAVSFEGSGYLLETGPMLATFPTTNVTVFVVSKPDTTSQFSSVINSEPDPNGNRFNIHLPNGNTVYWDFGDIYGGGRLQQGYTGGTNFHIWAFESAISAGQRIDSDGQQWAVNATSDDFVLSGQTIRLGREFSGDIAEIIVYDRLLSYPETSRVGYYLQEKYGISASYPAPTSLDLALTATALPEYVCTGETVQVTLTLVNEGPTNATGIVVSNTPPAELSITGADSPDFSLASGIWTVSALPYQASTSVTLTATMGVASLGERVTNTAAIVAVNETDFNSSNDTGSAEIEQWYDRIVPGDFAHSMTFELPGCTSAVPLLNFPVLIKLDTDMRQFDYADLPPAAADLRFTDESGTKLLLHEIDHWDTNGTSAIWVRALSLDADTAIVAYWGNPALTTPPEWTTNGAVWVEDYLLVWHLEQDGAQTRLDSTPNAFHSTSISNGPATAEGVIGLANVFDQTSRHVQRQYTPELNGQTFSVSLWVNSVDGQNYRCPLDMRVNGTANPSGGAQGFNIYEMPGNNWSFWSGRDPQDAWNQLTAGKVTPGEWQHLFVTYDGATVRFHINGVESGVRAENAFPPNTLAPFTVGSLGDSGWLYGGLIDDVRMHGAPRSASWVKTAYDNAAHYDEFVAAETAIRSDRASAVGTSTATLNGTLLWDEGQPTTVRVFWGTMDKGTNGPAWDASVDLGQPGMGAVSTSLGGLSGDNTYFYRFQAQNALGTVWADNTQRFHTQFTSITEGMVLWLTADALSDLADGETVHGWEDWSGAANDLVTFQGSPTYVTNAYNGRPAVAFAGSGLTHNDDAAGLAASPAMTVFIVATADAGGDKRCLQFGHRDGTSARVISFGLDCAARYNNGNRIFADSYVGQWAVGLFTRREGGLYGDVELFFDGVASTEASAGSPGTSLNLADHRITIGAGINAGGLYEPMAGRVAEILVYDRVLSVEEADEIGAYLAAKYSHPTTYGDEAISRSDFDHFMKIRFSGYDRAEVLTNFPALVRLSEDTGGFLYEQFASWDGEDLRFFDDDGVTPLDYEIEQWGVVPPIAAYHFEDDAQDSSVRGYHYDGTLRGVSFTANTPSGTGKALDFDQATGDDVIMTGFKGVSGSQPRTVSAWVRGQANNAPLVSWGNNTAGKKWIMRINAQAAPAIPGALRVEVNGGYAIGTTVLTDGAWHHVSAVLPDGVANVTGVRLFVDGVEETISASQGEPIDTDVGADVRVGGGHNAKESSGMIDDVAIWDRALTPLQIGRLYNNGTPIALDRGLTYDESCVWVRIPRFTPGKRIEARWGNPGLVGGTTPFSRASGGTWNSDYELVWHMREQDTQDSCAMQRDGTANGNTETVGIVAVAQAFDGASDVTHDLDTNVTLPSFTASVWAKADRVNLPQYCSSFNSGSTGRDFQFGCGGGNPANYRVNADHGNVAFGTVSTNWVYLAMTCDGSTSQLYYNGVPVSSYSGYDNVFGRFQVGKNRSGDTPYEGDVDEVRVSRQEASANWIWAVYHNIADYEAFAEHSTKVEGTLILVH